MAFPIAFVLDENASRGNLLSISQEVLCSWLSVPKARIKSVVVPGLGGGGEEDWRRTGQSSFGVYLCKHPEECFELMKITNC